MKMPAILMVGNFLSEQAGSRSVCEDLSLNLKGRGWQVTEASHKRQRIPRVLDMVQAVTIRRKAFDAAYVEVFSGRAFRWAELIVGLLSLWRRPVVLALHGGGLVEFAASSPKRVGDLLRRGSICVSASRFLQDGLKPYRDDIRYLPNGLHVSQYTYHSWRPAGPRIVWLRAFHKIYQPEFAVNILDQLLKGFPEASLTMIGPDKNDGSLCATREVAEKLGISSRISFVGAIEKSAVPDWLATADIFLNTTLYESFGVSVLEGALCGLPIVTTDAGELKHLWTDGETALVGRRNDIQSLAAAIRRLLTEKGLAERLSVAARKKAEKYDWSLVLPQWEALFREVLDGRSPKAL